MSTEERKPEIDSTNTEMESIKSVTVGCADVNALNPTLDIPSTVDKVCEVIKDGEINFEGMLHEEIGMYFAVNCKRN